MDKVRTLCNRTVAQKVFVRSLSKGNSFSRVSVGATSSTRTSKSHNLVRLQLRGFSTVKQTTGIVGLEVEPNARPILISLYQGLLKRAAEMPHDFGYRTALETLLNNRLAILEKESDIAEIEKQISFGQIEELIEHAKSEQKTLDILIKDKAWEVDENHTVTIVDAPTYKQRAIRAAAKSAAAPPK